MRIIVGLGNPGEQFEQTRHNAGFMALDAFADKLNLDWRTNKKLNASIAKTSGLILVKPLTFMNNSGQAVRAVMDYYGFLPRQLGIIRKKDSDLSGTLTVIHDDIDITFGQYKLSDNSRSAGHRGVASIICYLKTKNFRRVRVGIKTEAAERMDTQNFVLGKFSREERTLLAGLISRALTEVLNIAPDY